MFSVHSVFFNTVEPRTTDSRLIRTLQYIRTVSVSRVTNSYTLSNPFYGDYLSVHCEFSLSRLFANLKTLDPGQIMTEFEELKPFYYKEKLNSVTSSV